jgi:hypothetical protein
MTPSALRAIPAETTAAKVKDPNWKAAQADRESLTPEEFARRAGGDEASRDRAVNRVGGSAGLKTRLYNAWI